MSNIFYTSGDFQPSSTNPFNENNPYDKNWVFLKLVEDADYFLFTGKSPGSIFQVIITKKLIDWKYRIMDFIEYEKSHDKKIIIAVNSEDLDAAQQEYEGHCFKDAFLRPYEAKVLVHSTTWDSWQSINRDACLKSWNLLKATNSLQHQGVQPIGKALGDPVDYSDYIMFTNGGVTGEIVVSSKQKGKIEMDIDCPYKSGARLYFDAEKIANDGMLVRDGAHLKVKDKLPLKRYLIWAATLESTEFNIDVVTPRRFAEECDKVFEEKFKTKLLI